ncbi:hypothetical protein M3Y99_01702300 [Aphelenchoides fujianensis]|nr:hypothetical protein M3Y99_01702300 [Aphelenchoides fujianensis]
MFSRGFVECPDLREHQWSIVVIAASCFPSYNAVRSPARADSATPNRSFTITTEAYEETVVPCPAPLFDHNQTHPPSAERRSRAANSRRSNARRSAASSRRPANSPPLRLLRRSAALAATRRAENRRVRPHDARFRAREAGRSAHDDAAPAAAPAPLHGFSPSPLSLLRHRPLPVLLPRPSHSERSR